MSKVAIVTDSTSTIPKDLIEKYQITVAPQVVIWGEETYKDGVEIQPDEFYERLATSRELPTTSQVSVGDFQSIFQRLHGQGYAILCVLISSKLSGTIASAEQASQLAPEAQVQIADSQAVAMALGFQVLAAARKAQEGGDLDSCRAVAEKAVGHTGVLVTPETLEYLHRGGRIGGAARYLATALNIKPILELQNGRLEPLERVRTRKKVLGRMIELLEDRIAGRTPVRIAVLHANSHAEAQTIMEMVGERISADEQMISEVSPAIGVHTGPGTIALTYMAGM